MELVAKALNHFFLHSDERVCGVVLRSFFLHSDGPL